MSQIFPKWLNLLPFAAAIAGGSVAVGAILFIWWFFSPEYTDVGYAPVQPIPFSHKLHAGSKETGGLGMDCRYCHSNVEVSYAANIPSASTCMNCHANIKTNSEKLRPLYILYEHSYEKNGKQITVDGNGVHTYEENGKTVKLKPRQISYEGSSNLKFDATKPIANRTIEWVRVHNLPDYAYFSHIPHLNAGVGCVSCHGRIDQMEVVRQAEPLSMSWCLDCHRNPDQHIRPDHVKVTDMDWVQSSDIDVKALINKRKLNAPTDCTGCHR